MLRRGWVERAEVAYILLSKLPLRNGAWRMQFRLQAFKGEEREDVVCSCK